MDKMEIKRILREQKEPMDRAVAKKIAYLQSDEVFMDQTDDQTMPIDNSLLSAFSLSAEPVSVPQYNVQPKTRDTVKNMQTDYRPRFIENKPTNESIEEHKQNIAAKIAALRGISLPGDYLHNKK